MRTLVVLLCVAVAIATVAAKPGPDEGKMGHFKQNSDIIKALMQMLYQNGVDLDSKEPLKALIGDQQTEEEKSSSPENPNEEESEGEDPEDSQDSVDPNDPIEVEARRLRFRCRGARRFKIRGCNVRKVKAKHRYVQKAKYSWRVGRDQNDGDEEGNPEVESPEDDGPSSESQDGDPSTEENAIPDRISPILDGKMQKLFENKDFVDALMEMLLKQGVDLKSNPYRKKPLVPALVGAQLAMPGKGREPLEASIGDKQPEEEKSSPEEGTDTAENPDEESSVNEGPEEASQDEGDSSVNEGPEETSQDEGDQKPVEKKWFGCKGYKESCGMLHGRCCDYKSDFRLIKMRCSSTVFKGKCGILF